MTQPGDLPEASEGLFGVVVSLIKLGAIGLSGFIFLGILIVMLQGRPTDPQTAKLRQSYLRYGTFSAIAFALISLTQSYLNSSHKISLVFSPNFEVETLPPPIISLLGSTVQPAAPFTVDQDMQVVIYVDETLKRARELVGNVAALEAATSELAEQNEKISTLYAAAIRPGAKPPEVLQLNRLLQETQPARMELKGAIQAKRPDEISRITRNIGRTLGF